MSHEYSEMLGDQKLQSITQTTEMDLNIVIFCDASGLQVTCAKNCKLATQCIETGFWYIGTSKASLK